MQKFNSHQAVSYRSQIQVPRVLAQWLSIFCAYLRPHAWINPQHRPTSQNHNHVCNPGQYNHDNTIHDDTTMRTRRERANKSSVIGMSICESSSGPGKFKNWLAGRTEWTVPIDCSPKYWRVVHLLFAAPLPASLFLFPLITSSNMCPQAALGGTYTAC